MELVLENVTKSYKDVIAVNQLNYVMENGVYGLLGCNGAGKTTLIRMICALMKPDDGRILCNGKDIWQMDKAYRRLLGYLPQEYGFYPEFTAEEYLMYIASIKDLHPVLARKRTGELLSLVGMERYRKKKMKKFSGGMKRRIGIAQAMLNDPKILILDEPTAGLDPNERIRLRNLLSELSRDRLVLLSTHIVSDVEYIASEILLMKGGHIEDAGTTAALAARLPEQVYVCMVPESQVRNYLKKYRVANVRTTADGAELRILAAEQPVAGARQVPATLEDVFLYKNSMMRSQKTDSLQYTLSGV